VLRDLRISHATNGVALGFSGGQISLTNVQFVNCKYAIDFNGNSEDTVRIGNGLFYGVTNVLNSGYDNFLRGEHLTVHQCQKLFKIGNGNHNGEVYLTNSILANLAALGDADVFDGSHNGFYNCTPFGFSPFTNSTNPFQTVGAGAHYLATTNFRDKGTVVITIGLRFELQKKTTYPPVEITTNFTANTTLAPQAARDTNDWDLGFHYDPLDFVVGGRPLSADLTLTNGVALGVYGTSSSYGLGLSSGTLASEGTPNVLNWIVRYNTVQEQSTTNWSASSSGPSVKKLASSPVVWARFTGWSLPAGVADHFNDSTASTSLSAFRDCQFSGGRFTVDPGSTALTNCLWQRVYVKLRDMDGDPQWSLFNNLFYGGTLEYRATENPVMQAYDNLIDRTTIIKGLHSANFTHDYNAYLTNQNRLNPNGAHDVILTSLYYGSGPLGNFYQYPYIELDNAGSRDAYTAGLFHYTTKINQVKETNSIVEIGFHYIGVPYDTDSDGIPDYADPDSDGNDGLPDWWEQKYMGGLAETPSGDYDGDCLTNLFEYQQGSNPADQPAVTSAPVYQIVPTNVNVTFTVAGSPACVKYQWYKDYAAITGATNTSLTLTSVQLTSNALYKANIYSGAGVTSAAARLVALDGPAWTIYTNHLAHTNNKTINLWTAYGSPPTLAWDTNSLLYGKTGYTAISLSNSFKGTQGRITALTKRHGYSAGHHFQQPPYDDFGGHTNEKVWFLTADNQVEEANVAMAYVHRTSSPYYDYALFIFSNDLPANITPMAVMTEPSYVDLSGVTVFLGAVRFRTGQNGYMSANMLPFLLNDTSKPPFNEGNTFIQGDSGSANMIPTTDGSLVFIGGTTSSGPSEQMQTDMNKLTLYLNLNTNDYKLNLYTNYP